MTTMTSERLSKKTGEIRRALREGAEIVLTFRGTPFGRVVPSGRIDQLEAELDRLRKLVAEYGLTDQAQQVQEVAAA
jgi:antitoxin (DNA-binding transcriptional repressor) of toxin-antitoxin stability system